MRILVLNGPTLNTLGEREPEIYGTQTLADIEATVRSRADELGHEIDFRQSNHEGDLIDAILDHRDWDGLIINPGAFTHTSVALMDALAAAPKLVTVEVHLSNVHSREDFRTRSYIARHAWGQLTGFGARGYVAALDLLHQRLTEDGTSA